MHQWMASISKAKIMAVAYSLMTEERATGHFAMVLQLQPRWGTLLALLPPAAH
jgi:hypothetical protein